MLVDKNYITPAGFQKLKEEFHQLGSVERPKLVETVAWAASNGDRSENADYIYGKRRLREIDRRLGFLIGRLESAEVVDPTQIKNSRIVFGATVTVVDEEGLQSEYQIVGEDESDADHGKVSWKSPLAKSLMGKSEGDEVLFRRPAGEKILEIVAIRYV
ncbi:MAG: transcription elongation factor GreB [Bdellovibrionales bacterium]|nr:transcription elongation factor GreB [Bdellovibrionales bacterium]